MLIKVDISPEQFFNLQRALTDPSNLIERAPVVKLLDASLLARHGVREHRIRLEVPETIHKAGDELDEQPTPLSFLINVFDWLGMFPGEAVRRHFGDAGVVTPPATTSRAPRRRSD